jgi:3-(3-hydroxy-phenyl)propionate hydroxylase
MTPAADPIAIVGLGPTGGVLAALLADHGCSVLVLEQHPDVLQSPRAVFLDDEVMRVLQRIDCAAALLPQVRPVEGMDLVDRRGQVLYRYRPATVMGPLGWADGYMFHQPDLERVLRRAVEARAPVRVLAGTAVTGWVQDADGVTLQLRDHEGRVRITRAAFIVGCDGARSTIRRHMTATTLDVLGPDAQWIVVDLEMTGDMLVPPVTMQYCNPARPVTCVPLPGRSVRFEVRVLQGEHAEQLCERDALHALLAPWVPPASYRVRRVAPYTFHALLARGWREGRVLLAGDAAHQMPPFLGQGMGCGVRDAANLAWKLAAVWQGHANASLLDSYEAERGPATAAVIASDLRLGALIQTTDAAIAERRDAEALASGGAVPLSPKRFPLGPALGTSGPVAGLPFPQWRSAEGTLSDTLLGAGFAVVGAVRPSARVRASLERFGLRWLTDPPAAMAAWLAAHHFRAVVVRPDRTVLAAITEDAALEMACDAIAAHLTTPQGAAA